MKTKLLFFESNLYPSDHLATKLTTFYLSCHPSYGCYQSELESHPLADRKTKHIRNDNHILTQHHEIKVLREIRVNWTKRKGNKATGAKSHVPLECALRWNERARLHLCDQFSFPNEQGLWVLIEHLDQESWSCSLLWPAALCAKQKRQAPVIANTRNH